MSKITVRKGQIIQRKGEPGSKIYHVLDGLLRSYAIDEKGKEHIFQFAPEGWTIADTLSPTEPCQLFIDALEDSVVVLREKDPATETEPEKLLKRLGVLQQRVIMLMSAPAIERYEHFIETYPDIARRIPQKMIASYLGITPEALSKVKRERFEK